MLAGATPGMLLTSSIYVGGKREGSDEGMYDEHYRGAAGVALGLSAALVWRPGSAPPATQPATHIRACSRRFTRCSAMSTATDGIRCRFSG